MSKKSGPLAHSGAQILKAALAKVLGAAAGKTHSIEYDSAKKGTVSIKWSGDAPTAEQLNAVESAANTIIQSNASIQTLTMTRAEVEEKFRSNSFLLDIYNGDEPGDDVKEVQVVVIDGVSVNVCSDAQAAAIGSAISFPLSVLHTLCVCL